MKKTPNIYRACLAGLLLLALSSCRSDKEKLAARIGDLEGKVLDDSTMVVDRKVAAELIGAYEEFATRYPEDTLAAQYLFKAGDYANGTGDYAGAIRYYGQCSAMENFPKKEVAFFLQGFIYENQLGDLENARRIYTEFLERYPDHPLADDVRFSLRNLGKSPEDLIHMFEQQDSLSNAAADTLPVS